MNAYAADYDSTHFSSPYTFNPERYLKSTDSSGTELGEAEGTPHYGYGAGSRMCAGSHLANRELYTAFLRLIIAFELLPPKKEEDKPILDALEANAVPTSLTLDPKKFKVGFRIRDRESLERWIEESEDRTKEL